MKIISINVNGIRSAHNKGLLAWLRHENPDFICLQEIKAQKSDIPIEIANLSGYYAWFNSATQKGYSGVAILAKVKPNNIICCLDNHISDNEGRYLQFDYQEISIVSIYLPSGTSGDAFQTKKFKFLEFYAPLLMSQLRSGRKYIICGDMNIAHTNLDLKNYKANQKHSGFLPEERAWLDGVFNSGWIDTYRYLYPQTPGYTWWSNRGNAYANNVGWRIDYQIVTPNLKDTIIDASIFKEIKFSDHAPLIVNYSIPLLNQ